MNQQRPQHYRTPKPFDDVSYGMYIESLLAGERRTGDERRSGSEGRNSAVTLPPTGAGTRGEGGGDLAALRRNARTTDREALTALAEAHGWTRTNATSYDKDGWPQLDIPEVIGDGDALTVINGMRAESAAGGE
ncbi:MAG: hypothetical protein WC211_00080 [Dehalococcoidia bacterium]